MNASNQVHSALVILGTATAAQVAQRADVSVATARKWLDQFVSVGSAESMIATRDGEFLLRHPITRYAVR